MSDEHPNDEDLVPSAVFGQYRNQAATNPPFMPSPLPPVAATYYTTGGCWNLALALHAELTGSSIEVFRRGGLPRHAYVVRDEIAFDAFGPRPVRFARVGADDVSVVSPASLLDEVANTPNGRQLVALVKREDFQDAARRAARFILQITPG